ncbi:MAG: exoribonuclease II [Arsenophonus endosymbiont of Ceratovacuna japonica]
MLQDNQLLAQLKKKLHTQTIRVEGIVKSTEKSFGFLEVNKIKTYFIPSSQMKKVMHGDKIIAIIHTYKNREIVEPEILIKPFITKFIGRIQKKDNDHRLYIKVDNYILKENIFCQPAKSFTHNLIQNDWVIAKIHNHPLKNQGTFKAEIIKYITNDNDYYAPWLVTLNRYKLEREAPKMQDCIIEETVTKRLDLTHLNFITIDSLNTEDMDDALYIEKIDNNELRLFVAIADPTSYITENSKLDNIAKQRGYTNYLPGFNIPMLPRELSDDLCSLRPNERRPALVCQFNIKKDGQLNENIKFYLAWIESKNKLNYDDVSDWLEQEKKIPNNNKIIKQQISLLNEMCKKRFSWRKINALIFKERPDYNFIFDTNGNIINILINKKRIAHRIVEEAMIAANLCATKILKNKLKIGIFNTHIGFEPTQINKVITILQENNIKQNAETLLTIEGFRNLKRLLDDQPTKFLDSRLRRFQTFTEIKTTPTAHYGLGFDAYATWTSPIRKYTDIINHRFLKAIINNEQHKIIKPSKTLIAKITERKRYNRLAKRDINNWLYVKFLRFLIKTNNIFSAEITNITKSGIRVKLRDNGASAFIPITFIHSVRKEIQCNQESGTIIIKGIAIYKLNDIINIQIEEIIMETRNIIAKII